MKSIFFAGLTLFTTLASSTPISPFPVQRLPFGPKSDARPLPHEGTVTGGAKWRDRDGLHVVLLTLSPGPVGSLRYGGPDSTLPEVRLRAHHYLRIGGRWKRVWLMSDSLAPCEVDVTAEFLPKSLTVTDLDRDGIAEVTFLYRLACRGDVSPSTQKLLMYEGRAKYALRGATHVKLGAPRYEGGNKTFDAAFARAPASFRAFALRRWNVYKNE